MKVNDSHTEKHTEVVRFFLKIDLTVFVKPLFVEHLHKIRFLSKNTDTIKN